MGPDERVIREVHSTWIDAVNAGDQVRLLTLMADDVVFLNPDQAPFGRDGFSANFSAERVPPDQLVAHAEPGGPQPDVHRWRGAARSAPTR